MSFNKLKFSKLKIVCSLTLSLSLIMIGVTSASATPEPALDLKSAATFSALGLTVSNTGPNTSMSGDFGITTGAPTGTPLVTSGASHIVDAGANQAMLDMQSAYNDAISRTSTFAIAGDLAGVTLHPGVYSSGGAAISQSTTLTFDAAGDSSAVFIIKIGGALSAAATSNMVLINGARAQNIFWVVGGAVGFAAQAHAVGTIISIGALSMGDGASISGRTLTSAALNLYNTSLTDVISAAATAAAQAAAETAAAAQAVIDASNVVNLINTTPLDRTASRTAYNALSSAAKLLVTNYAVLTGAETAATAAQAVVSLTSPADGVTKNISNADGGAISVFLVNPSGALIPVSLLIPSNASTEDLKFTVTSPVASTDTKPGFVTIKIIALNAANVEVTKFIEPLQINLGKLDSNAAIASSQDGHSWLDIKKLTGTTLSSNDQDGYYLNDKSEVIILTLHLTSFGSKSKMEDLDISTSEKTFILGEDFQLAAIGVMGTGHVWYDSLATDICDVTSSGRVISFKTGNCYITISVSANGIYMDAVSAPKLFVIESAIQTEQLLTTKVGTIFFTRSTSALDHNAYLALAKVLALLAKQGKFTLKVIGYSDQTLGLDNSVLSLSRAKSVVSYLRKNLITSKISFSGAGNSQPVAIGRTADQLNRRVEIWSTIKK